MLSRSLGYHNSSLGLSAQSGLWAAQTLFPSRIPPSQQATVSSRMSRNSASEDFLEPAQSSLSICLNCGDLAISVPSCWFGCLSFTLVRFSAIPTFIRFYSNRSRTMIAILSLGRIRLSNPYRGLCAAFTET